MDLKGDKKALRREMLARRDAVAVEAQAAGPALAAQFEKHVLPHLHHGLHDTISGYWPMGSEADVRPILRLLERHGFSLCLPVVVAKETPLVFRRWHWGAPMEKGHWNIGIPADPQEVTPRALLVPLLAFDDAGYRLGYGGGFYDRTIDRLKAAGHPPFTIGIALDQQKIDAVPHESWDERLDIILTPDHCHLFGAPSEAAPQDR
jgi:5-formyltetrahydrofolate cyclo-ligase